MDRAMMLRHLAQAEWRVAEGEAHLARQRTLIRNLERDGQSARAARLFLSSLEETQAAHMADRDRVRAQLRHAQKPLRTPRATASRSPRLTASRTMRTPG
jgi:hypothetical protein